MLTRLKNDADLVLDWLQSNTGWHYGMDIAESVGIHRCSIYVHLDRLEERGLVERNAGEKTNPGLPRPLFRAALAAKAQGENQ